MRMCRFGHRFVCFRGAGGGGAGRGGAGAVSLCRFN